MRGRCPRIPGPPSGMGGAKGEQSSPRPGRQSPAPKPPRRQGLAALGPAGRPLPPREPGVAARVPDRGDDTPASVIAADPTALVRGSWHLREKTGAD